MLQLKGASPEVLKNEVLFLLRYGYFSNQYILQSEQYVVSRVQAITENNVYAIVL